MTFDASDSNIPVLCSRDNYISDFPVTILIRICFIIALKGNLLICKTALNYYKVWIAEEIQIPKTQLLSLNTLSLPRSKLVNGPALHCNGLLKLREIVKQTPRCFINIHGLFMDCGGVKSSLEIIITSLESVSSLQLSRHYSS